MLPNEKPVALGVDIGGTRIKTVALEYPDKILLENRIDSHAKDGPNAVRRSISTAVKFYSEKGLSFSRIGVGCAGSVDPRTGVVLNSPNFSDWFNVPLRRWVEEDFGVPATVANDANCAAFTEWKLGNARDVENAILLTFGTGVGGGIISNGGLYTGSTGSAGELGHFSIHADGIDCACGNKGCFERYCSASALELELPGYTAKEIFAGAKSAPFDKVIARFLREMKIGITSMANVFDPDVILIGGGLLGGITAYLDEIRTHVREHAFPAVSKHVRIEPTKFMNQSGAIGAALIALSDG